MIVYDVAMKLLDTESFSQHNIAGLIPGVTFIVLFSQKKPFMVEGTKHTLVTVCMLLCVNSDILLKLHHNLISVFF